MVSVFLSLDYVYVPTPDVDAASAAYVDVLGASLEWKIRGMGTVVACVRVADSGPDLAASATPSTSWSDPTPSTTSPVGWMSNDWADRRWVIGALGTAVALALGRTAR